MYYSSSHPSVKLTMGPLQQCHLFGCLRKAWDHRTSGRSCSAPNGFVWFPGGVSTGSQMPAQVVAPRLQVCFRRACCFSLLRPCCSLQSSKPGAAPQRSRKKAPPPHIMPYILPCARWNGAAGWDMQEHFARLSLKQLVPLFCIKSSSVFPHQLQVHGE